MRARDGVERHVQQLQSFDEEAALLAAVLVLIEIAGGDDAGIARAGDHRR